MTAVQLSHDAADRRNGFVDAQIAAGQRWQGGVDDELISRLHAKVASELDAGDFTYVGYGTAELVKLLLARAREDDLMTANRIVARLETEMSAISQPALGLWPLLCRALLANAIGDTTGYNTVLARYRDLAADLDARGHLVTVTELPDSGAS
jgi:hypothetical protein